MKALFRAIKSVGQDGGSEILDRVQAAIQVALDRLGNVVSNDKLIPATIGTNDTSIAHGLGGRFSTWEIVRKSANADVWEAAAQPSPEKFLVLKASAAVTVTLRVS